MNDLILPIGDIANNYDPNPMIVKHGRGPDGKTCRACLFIIGVSPAGNRRYWKCSRHSVSRSESTDHRLKWAACRLYVEAT